MSRIPMSDAHNMGKVTRFPSPEIDGRTPPTSTTPHRPLSGRCVIEPSDEPIRLRRSTDRPKDYGEIEWVGVWIAIAGMAVIGAALGDWL